MNWEFEWRSAPKRARSSNWCCVRGCFWRWSVSGLDYLLRLGRPGSLDLCFTESIRAIRSFSPASLHFLRWPLLQPAIFPRDVLGRIVLFVASAFWAPVFGFVAYMFLVLARPATVEGWVVTVATNLAIDRIRRRRRPPTSGTEPVALVDTHLPERVDLARALQHLTRRQRDVVVLRYLADRSELEVAETLGCSPGSVKTHASRGLAALRMELGDIDAEGGDDARASR